MTIAFDHYLPAGLDASRRPAWQDGDPELPALYISHGAPPLLEDAAWIDELSAWADTLPVPRGILIVSAHWEAAPLSLSAVAPGNVVYDFSGFHPRYNRMRYDTPDASGLAADVLATLPDGWTCTSTPPAAWTTCVGAAQSHIPGGRHPRAATEPAHAQAGAPAAARLPSGQLAGARHPGDRLRVHDPRPAVPDTRDVLRERRTRLVAGVRRVGHRALPAGTRRTGGLPRPRARHAVLPSHGRALHPAVRYPGRADGTIETTVEGYAFGLSKRSLQTA